jgi:hypothetical protein
MRPHDPDDLEPVDVPVEAMGEEWPDDDPGLPAIDLELELDHDQEVDE